MRATFEYCLKSKLLGVGWRVDGLANTKDWSRYHKEAVEVHGKVAVCKYIQTWVNEGDLVWTRDTLAQYYLARVSSGWEYRTSEESVEQDIDIANIFRCDIKKVARDAVPGKVVASFRARKSIQEVADDTALEYSKFLWNVIAGSKVYELEDDFRVDIFAMLDDKETEDLLFIYLQTQGWYVIPNSRERDTVAFEYFLVRADTGEIAAAQVKTGNVPLNPKDYCDYPHRVFLFQSNDIYGGEEADNVICLQRKEVEVFLEKALDWLPKVFKIKMALSERSTPDVSLVTG